MSAPVDKGDVSVCGGHLAFAEQRTNMTKNAKVEKHVAEDV